VKELRLAGISTMAKANEFFGTSTFLSIMSALRWSRPVHGCAPTPTGFLSLG